ncbi:hypothetical protein E2C01_048345 [Portunus trituberculatus]|uniref:Uncharacterized protein n=1 Tax=Portunus trituberculatus TaxID=210409 RepID=A0A5B7G9Z2_PORTR|nr:hypothetical protein [Portunus trituberculatus]
MEKSQSTPAGDGPEYSFAPSFPAVFLADLLGTLDCVSGARCTCPTVVTTVRSAPNDKGTLSPSIINFWFHKLTHAPTFIR